MFSDGKIIETKDVIFDKRFEKLASKETRIEFDMRKSGVMFDDVKVLEKERKTNGPDVSNEFDGLDTHREDDATKGRNLESDRPTEVVDLDERTPETLIYFLSLWRSSLNTARAALTFLGYDQANVTSHNFVHSETITVTFAEAFKAVKFYEWMTHPFVELYRIENFCIISNCISFGRR